MANTSIASLAAPVISSKQESSEDNSSSGNDATRVQTQEEKKTTKRRTMVHWRVEPYRSQMVQAICLVRQSGMSTKSVAERFKIPPRTLRRYVSDPSRLGLDIVFPAFEKRRRRRKSVPKNKATTTPKSTSAENTNLLKTPHDLKDKRAVSSKTDRVGNIEWDVEEEEDTKTKMTMGPDGKVKLNHSRRWTAEPYRSQMLRAISMIQRQGISMSQVATICDIPARTLRRYLNNTIKLHKMLKENGITAQFDQNGTVNRTKKESDEIEMSSVMDLMSLGNLKRRKKRSRSTSEDEIQPSGRYHHLASPRSSSRSSSSGSFDSPRGSAVGWTTRKRSLSSESLEMRGKQLQHALMYKTKSSITSADAAQQLLRMPTLTSQQRKIGDHVMIRLEDSHDGTQTISDECKEEKSSSSSSSIPRWIAGKVSNIRNVNGARVIDVAYVLFLREKSLIFIFTVISLNIMYNRKLNV